MKLFVMNWKFETQQKYTVPNSSKVQHLNGFKASFVCWTYCASKVEPTSLNRIRQTIKYKKK